MFSTLLAPDVLVASDHERLSTTSTEVVFQTPSFQTMRLHSGHHMLDAIFSDDEASFRPPHVAALRAAIDFL